MPTKKPTKKPTRAPVAIPVSSDDRRKALLQVRPRGVGPSTWSILSTDPVEFEWHTVIANIVVTSRSRIANLSGHSLGISDDPDNLIEWLDLASVVNAWFEADEAGPWAWEFRMFFVEEE